MFYVVLLAMVAAFLAMRLYIVLGKRTGHEQEVLPRPLDKRTPLPLPHGFEPQVDVRETPGLDGRAASGLRAITAADPRFDAVEFVEGAKNAYRLVLEAFWKGDSETLEWLCEQQVARAFEDAVAARNAAGETLGNRLVQIERAAITAASIENGIAKVSVRFDADIAAATRDAAGNLVSGSLTDAVEQHDVWTFARMVKSDDPNWKLAETDEA